MVHQAQVQYMPHAWLACRLAYLLLTVFLDRLVGLLSLAARSLSLLPLSPAVSSPTSLSSRLVKRSQDESDDDSPPAKSIRLLPAINLPCVPGLRPPSITVNYGNLHLKIRDLHVYSDASVELAYGFACVAWRLCYYEEGDR